MLVLKMERTASTIYGLFGDSVGYQKLANLSRISRHPGYSRLDLDSMDGLIRSTTLAGVALASVPYIHSIDLCSNRGSNASPLHVQLLAI